MTTSSSIYFSPPLIRASDADRDEALRQLRGHWMAGRLALDEYEERCGQAAQARYQADLTTAVRELPASAPAPVPARAPEPVVVVVPATGQTEAVGSLVMGILGLIIVVMSVGFLFVFSLPLSMTAWAVGRSGRKSAPGGGGGARAGEILGIVGTFLGLMPVLLIVVL
jgi:Domain of unknown function (DUF1707)